MRFFAFACLALPTLITLGSEVNSDVSTRETLVGLPVTFQIHFTNTIEHDQPVIPEVEGVTIEQAGPPSRSHQTSIVNGRRSERSVVTYNYRVTPLREGTFTIPPIQVSADGKAMLTRAAKIVATKGETDDLLFVEITGSESEIYVGQALELSLRIWIRPFRDPKTSYKFKERDTWQLISNESQWGPFRDRMIELANSNRRPEGRSVLREDSEGNNREYWLYRIDATIYPDRPTEIDGQDVRIVVDYPLELTRSRSPFSMLDDEFFQGTPFGSRNIGGFSSLRISRERPLVADAKIDPIDVMPVPTEGRPSDYVGAVGQYEIFTGADPTSVQVGDPITLHIGIEGDGLMDYVRAPPLHLQQDLVRDFRVPNEPLAGTVNRSTKAFTTTIRPRDTGVTQIPPIEYSYFDPNTQEFVRTRSAPIDIQVTPAEVLAMDAIVGNRGNGGGRDTMEGNGTASSNSTGLLFQSSESAVNTVPAPQLFSPRVVAMLAAAPTLFACVLLFCFRAVPAALIPARRRLRSSLLHVQSMDEIGEALERFLVSQFRIAPGQNARDQSIGALRANGRADLAIEAERIFAGEQGQSDLASWTVRTLQLTDEAAGLPQKAPRTHQNRLSPTATLLLAIFVSCGMGANVSQADQPSPSQLTEQQKVSLFSEGLKLFETARENPDEVEARDQYLDAAGRFQLIVDTGVENDQLYFNLAESYLRAGNVGMAIAHYRNALRLSPDNADYYRHLAAANQNSAGDDRESGSAGDINDAVLAYVSPRTMRLLCIASWTLLWLSLAIGMLRPNWAWRRAAAAFAVVFAASGASYFLRFQQFARDDVAVVVAPRAVIRAGDDPSFDELAELVDREGETLELVGERGDWIRVRLASGREGWIHQQEAQPISAAPSERPETGV